jgi:hypothetical protein
MCVSEPRLQAMKSIRQHVLRHNYYWIAAQQVNNTQNTQPAGLHQPLAAAQAVVVLPGYYGYCLRLGSSVRHAGGRVVSWACAAGGKLG